MKNVYSEGDSSMKKEEALSGSAGSPEAKTEGVGQSENQNSSAAQQIPQGYVQVPYGYVPIQPDGQPGGYYYGPQGIPVPQIQLTPEQIAFLVQQYIIPQQYAQPGQQSPQYAPQGVQYYQQPQFVQPLQYAQPGQQPSNAKGENNTADSGMRILYQSPDFDNHTDRRDRTSAPQGQSFSAAPKKEQDKAPAREKEAPSAGSSLEIETKEHIVIEEETISFSGRAPKTEPPKEKVKAAPERKFSIDEMEMSTFELDSIILKDGRAKTSRTKPDESDEFSQLKPRSGYASTSFSVEEAFEETVEPKKPAQKKTKESKKNTKTEKKSSSFDIIRKIVLGISLAAIVISSAVLINEYRLSKENDRLEQEVSDLILDVDTTEPDENEEPTDKDENEEPDITQEPTTAPLTPEQQWAQIKAEYPNVVFPDFIQLKYAKLYATNRDFVGYLEADGVGLSLPVVQGDDDNEYMEKNFYGKKTKYGCPFVTHLNDVINFDQNTIIFGHHMNNGTVFGALDKYKSIEGFKKAPVITFNTLYSDYSWKVVAAFVTNAYKEQDNGYVFRYYFTTLSTQERFSAYLNEISQRSIYDTGVDVLPTDKLLTLSTCSHEFEEARFVVVARLVRPGESTDVDVSRATVNENPRYPQAYYDKKKIDNPYINAGRWEVG